MKKLFISFAALCLVASVYSCRETEKKADEMGDSIEETMEEAGDKMEEAMDTLAEKTEKTFDAAKKSMED